MNHSFLETIASTINNQSFLLCIIVSYSCIVLLFSNKTSIFYFHPLTGSFLDYKCLPHVHLKISQNEVTRLVNAKKKKKGKNVKSIPEIYFLDKNKKIISTIGETRNKA